MKFLLQDKVYINCDEGTYRISDDNFLQKGKKESVLFSHKCQGVYIFIVGKDTVLDITSSNNLMSNTKLIHVKKSIIF